MTKERPMNDDTKEGLIIYADSISNSINTVQVLGNILEEMLELYELTPQKQLFVSKLLNKYIETTKKQLNNLQIFITKQ